MNQKRAQEILEHLKALGLEECCCATGKRNAPFIVELAKRGGIKAHFWPEERSAAFFALGRARRTQKPVACFTTSGSAVAEMLPAVMEAYYTGVPLICISADWPRRFRGTGSPQCVEQVGIFGPHAHCIDVARSVDFSSWNRKGPLHLNVSFEEPLIDGSSFEGTVSYPETVEEVADTERMDRFFETSRKPIVVVSTLPERAREAVASFLMKLKVPVYLEAPSGLRGDHRLQKWQIHNLAGFWDQDFDGILRIGGIPTFRPWRDLDAKKGTVVLCSVTEQPFKGLSWGEVVCTPLELFFKTFDPPSYDQRPWKCPDMTSLFEEEPQAEPSLIYQLSQQIPEGAHVYLGNSLPIREWDLAACSKRFDIQASRGVNGIDGQLSTFFGLCDSSRSNWAILGDLTALYDLAAPWILSQLESKEIKIVIINNGGGKIFERFFPEKEFLNEHTLRFHHFAAFWNLEYATDLTSLPDRCLIELIPDPVSTENFWKKHGELCRTFQSTLCTVS